VTSLADAFVLTRLRASAAATPTAEFDSVWGVGFMTPENFVRFAYQSLEP
jgi:hypothetical protein